jgi:hypothetical protein
MNSMLIPKGGENPYAGHPGFDAQGCELQYTVTPAEYSSSHHGFGCYASGGHCLPGKHCNKLQAEEKERQEAGGEKYGPY